MAGLLMDSSSPKYPRGIPFKPPSESFAQPGTPAQEDALHKDKPVPASLPTVTRRWLLGLASATVLTVALVVAAGVYIVSSVVRRAEPHTAQPPETVVLLHQSYLNLGFL